MATRRKTPQPKGLENDLGALIRGALDDRSMRQKDLINALPVTALQSKKLRSVQPRAGTYIKKS
jgi:hypothetical protein